MLSPWWPGRSPENRALASSSWAAIMFLTSASSGCRRPVLKSERPAGPPCRARAVPCPLTSADRDHAALANSAHGAGYHASVPGSASLPQYIRRYVQPQASRVPSTRHADPIDLVPGAAARREPAQVFGLLTPAAPLAVNLLSCIRVKYVPRPRVRNILFGGRSVTTRGGS